MHAPWTLSRTLALPHADDADWVTTAAGITDGQVFSVPAVNGQAAAAIQLAWCFTTAAGVVVAPTGTYSYRLIELVDPALPGSQVYAGAAVVGAAFADEVHIANRPGAGALYALRVYTVAGAPGAATAVRLYVKGAL